MNESMTYQKILSEGRQEGENLGRIREARRLLRLQGTKRFSVPSSTIAALLEGIQDVDRLEALAARIIEPDLGGWEDLLGC